MKFAQLFISILFLTLVSTLALAQVTNYLILEDIGSYKLFTGIPGRVFSGPPKQYSMTATGGVLNGAGHFSENNISYEASYRDSSSKWPSVRVEVTQHIGSDSDRWLLHEIEDAYRDDEIESLGIIIKGTRLREINGDKFISLRGSGYSWISNNVVVHISCRDLYGNKPEPLEVIQAYLQKFRSTIPSTLVLNRTHDEQWIKDEMERRLWLCDKWFVQLESDRPKLSSILKTVVDHMSVFLAYREKYFGVSGKDDASALMRYLTAKDETSIKNKLAGYKSWWNANKTGSINLP